MKKRATLTLAELAVMLAVFAVAAVICLRVFIWAEVTSKNISDTDSSLIAAQSAAETLKAHAGDMQAAAPSGNGE